MRYAVPVDVPVVNIVYGRLWKFSVSPNESRLCSGTSAPSIVRKFRGPIAGWKRFASIVRANGTSARARVGATKADVRTARSDVSEASDVSRKGVRRVDVIRGPERGWPQK